MYVKLNMYDALTYVMGRTCLCRHVHARERCVWLHSRMFYLVRFVSLPRDARQQFLRALMCPPVVSPHRALLIASTTRARASA